MPGVAARQLAGVEDVAGVEGGQRDLGGADQEEVVALVGLVDHLALAREHPGAVQRAPRGPGPAGRPARSPRRGRRRPRGAPARAGPAPGRRGGRRTARPRPRRPSPSRSIRGAGRARGGRRPRSRTRAARRPRAATTASSSPRRPGRPGAGRLGSVAASSSRAASTSASSAPGPSPAAATSRICGDQRLGVAARALRLGDLVGRGVLLRAQLLDLRQQLAAARVEAQQLVEVVGGTAAGQRLHGRAPGSSRMLRRSSEALPAAAYSVPGAGPDSSDGLGVQRRRRRWAIDVAARVLGDELGDGLGLLADDDVLRHDRAGEAAVADRVEHVLLGLDPLVEVRALVAQRAVGRADGPGGAQRVAARRSARRRAPRPRAAGPPRRPRCPRCRTR